MGIKQVSLKGLDRFRQRGMGTHRRQCDAFKFRTGDVNGDEILASFPDFHKELALNHKQKNDPRITHLGIFLRKTCPDELRYLINILQGHRHPGSTHTLTSKEAGKYIRGASLPGQALYL